MEPKVVERRMMRCDDVWGVWGVWGVWDVWWVGVRRLRVGVVGRHLGRQLDMRMMGKGGKKEWSAWKDAALPNHTTNDLTTGGGT